MPKTQSVTVNGVSLDIEFWKNKTESDFVKHEAHNFSGEKEAKETWALFQKTQKTPDKEIVQPEQAK